MSRSVPRRVVCCVGLASALVAAACSVDRSASSVAEEESSVASVRSGELNAYGLRAHNWIDGGKRIAFQAADSNGYGCNHRSLDCLWVMNAGGRHKRKLAPDSELASVSPSGRLLARLVYPYPGRRRHRLVITTLAGTQVRTFGFHPWITDESEIRPTWAPDESVLAFEGDTGIYVAERGKGVRVVARGPFLYSPAWSPDSRLLAFRRCPEEAPSARCDLMVIRRDGSHLGLVARDIDTELPLGWGPPLPNPWSPDGRWLAFARKDRIFVIHPGASGLRRVAADTAYRLAWSPDGKRLAYTGPEGIHVVHLRGGKALRLTAKKAQDSLFWAPSRRILYSRRGVIWTAVPGHAPVAVR